MKKNIHVTGSKVEPPKFYCSVCGQEFDDRNERNDHEAICRELGYTQTPRPKDLSKYK